MLVLDIGRQVSAEDLEAGKNIVRMLVQQKLLFTKRDELGLLLVGTQGSRDWRAIVLALRSNVLNAYVRCHLPQIRAIP